MRLFIPTLTLALLISVGASPVSPAPGQTASPQQDSAATSTDQTTKPAEPKGTALIGCLSGPDSDAKFTLRNMSHRTGVEVFGPENLKDDSGSKVKLTGSWKPVDQPVKGKEARKFQATDIEVLAQKCEAPSEKTPVSKEKQQKQQQQKQKSSSSAPADTEIPKQ